MNPDKERLLRLAEMEDDCPSISVGGLMHRLGYNFGQKILFLDIDGVLNSAEFLCQNDLQDPISKEMVARINRVVDATGCKIVISSMWRFCWPLEQIKPMLGGYGLRDVVIDYTPRLLRRDAEILSWLTAHPDVTQFVAVDDNDGDMGDLGDRLVKTSWAVGITDEDANKLIALLS